MREYARGQTLAFEMQVWYYIFHVWISKKYSKITHILLAILISSKPLAAASQNYRPEGRPTVKFNCPTWTTQYYNIF